MSSFQHPQNLTKDNLKMKSVLSGDFPQFVGFAPAGAADADKVWQLSERTYNTTSGELHTVEFAQDQSGEETNLFKFSWVASAQVLEIKVSNELLPGNTATIDVDGMTVSEVFATDHDTTMAAWAVGIAGEAGVTTAVLRGRFTIVVTAAVAGTEVVLDNADVTGSPKAGSAEVTFKTTVENQVAPASMTYGV